MDAEETTEALRLDGNAAAGVLAEIFAGEITLAETICAGCGATRSVGALLVYGGAMGTIVRCPGCDGVMIRVARTRDRLWLDLRGVRSLSVSRGS